MKPVKLSTVEIDRTSAAYLIGQAFVTDTGKANEAGKAVQTTRGTIQQQMALFFAGLPTVAEIENAAAGAAEAATKKTDPTASQIRKLGKEINPDAATVEAKYGRITFKRSEDGSILSFGNGTMSKEYNALLLKSRSAAQIVADYEAEITALEAAINDLRVKHAIACATLKAEYK